jgi:Bacterial Ig-like domain (group 3)/Putative Ig domain
MSVVRRVGAARKASVVVSTHVRWPLAAIARVTAVAITAVGLSAGAAPALAAPAVAAAPAATGAPAAAAPAALPSQCVQSGTTDTCVFTSQGQTTFTVPQNLSSIQVTAVGGHGGSSIADTPGGLGAVASGTIAVTDGESLYLEVNVLGGSAGHDSGLVDAGGGGGESDVRTCPAAGTCSSGTTLASRLLVAGGGGGGGDGDGAGQGGNAGTTGNAANGTPGIGGFENAGGGDGATTTGPGNGGDSCGDGGSNGSPGASGGGAGGAGGNSNSVPGNSGGGGGAGEFGGGGGGGCAVAVDFGGSGGGGTSGAASSVTSTSFTQATSGEAASITLVFTAPFAVTTTSLPDGTFDQTYDLVFNQTLAAANGTAPYTWTIDGGSLPTGLSLNAAGAFGGAPSAPGTFDFTVEATDSATPAETAIASLSITILQASTSVAGGPNPAFPAFGTPVGFVVQVLDAFGGPASGSVQFVVDGSDFGAPVSLGVFGVASGTFSPLPVGNHSFEIEYLGSTNDLPSSTSGGFAVLQATPGLDLAAAPSSNATVASPVTLTATLSGPSGVTGPTGSVSFTVDGSPASCGEVTISGSQAQCSLGDLSAGTHSFGASYGGDTNYETVTGSVTGYSVSKLTSSEQITANPSSPDFGEGVSFTDTVTTDGNPVTGGTVQWLVDGTDSGSPVTVGSDGTASLGPIADLSVGSHTIEADYSGSDQDTATTAQTSINVGQAAPALDLAASPSSGATVATPVTLTATVIGVAGVATPTGSVSFTVNGSPASCGSVTVSGSQAQCSLGDLPANTYSFGASYSGDGNYEPTSGSLVSYGVSLLTTAEAITPSVASPVFGQPVGFTVTVTSAGNPVSSGSVQWLVDGADAGSPVPVGPDGTATLGPLSDLSVGMHAIEADYSGTSQFATTTQQTGIVVGQADTKTAVTVTKSALYATIAPVAPGAGIPTGTVTFTVNGTIVGTANLPASGMAKLSHQISGAVTVSASYSGDDSFAPSSASTATTDPKITATISSKFPKTKYGWYRSPVTVTFTCTPGSAPLASPCPSPVTLSKNGAAQLVSRTIHGKDGGIATVVVSPINIDQLAPKVVVTGAENGATYDAPGPAKLTCTAADSLSGLAGPCRLVINRSETELNWTATATDKAGNTAKVTGKVHLIDYFVAGVTRTAGRYVVTVGKTYTVNAYILSATTVPKYVFAAPDGQAPHPVGPKMTKIGSHLWAIRIDITAAMDKRYKNWAVGVLSGGALHIILLTLKR